MVMTRAGIACPRCPSGSVVGKPGERSCLSCSYDPDATRTPGKGLPIGKPSRWA